MKSLILLLALTILSQIKSYSQVWAPVGAKWTYSDVSMDGSHSITYLLQLSVQVIPLLVGNHARIFIGGCECSFSPGIEFLYYEDDKVYYYVDSIVGFTHAI